MEPAVGVYHATARIVVHPSGTHVVVPLAQVLDRIIAGRGARLDTQPACARAPEFLRQQLPLAAARIAAGAGHYSFIAPPTPEFRTLFGPAAQDPPGFDRESFQAELSSEAVEFFSKALR